MKKFGKNVVQFVVGAEDKSVLRDYHSEIKGICQAENIDFFTRKNVPQYQGYAMAVGWRWIIPYAEKLIIFHDSLLPKYRGFAPLAHQVCAAPGALHRPRPTNLNSTTRGR